MGAGAGVLAAETGLHGLCLSVSLAELDVRAEP